MKNYSPYVIMLVLLLVGCERGKNSQNSFSSSNDTLVINTAKQKGFGVFPTGSGTLYLKDTSERFITSIVYPAGIEHLRRNEKCIDLKALAYYSHKRGETFFWEQLAADIESKRIDTTIFLPETENYINILEGIVDGKKVVIVDENSNKDLTDDRIRIFEEMEWPNPDHFVEIRFSMSDGKKIVDEKSWISFRTMEEDEQLWIGKCEHVVAGFSIDDKQFRIAAINHGTGDFTYDQYSPSLLLFALLKDRGDSIVCDLSDRLQLGQFIKLDDQYYCLMDISHNGGQMTLVKENDFLSQVGTQVGMLAPEFTCITEKGDTLHSRDLKDKGIIVVNMCGCSGNNGVFRAYEDILSVYGESYHVLGVDSQFGTNTTGTLINSLNPFNADFAMKYRQDYCSYITYVIDNEHRIENKFITMKWQDFL